MTDPAREDRSRLSGAKLSALVSSNLADGPVARLDEPLSFGAGAALVAGDWAWVLVDGDATGALGPALAWASGRDAEGVTVIGDEGMETLARRAALFDLDIEVRQLDGTDLVEVQPAQTATIPPHPGTDGELARRMAAAGLTVVVEHGILLGEFLGLEVARVVAGDDGDDRIEVGVGKYDRELTAMVHQDQDVESLLERVVGIVFQHRRSDGPPHPLRALAPERWLRHRLVEQPELAGCRELHPSPSPFARLNLLGTSTAAASGNDRVDDGDVVVVSSVGIDLDLVPTAADTRRHLDPGARLRVVVPERDRHRTTQLLADHVVGGCEVLGVDDDWRSAL